jgi:hypothetical protein
MGADTRGVRPYLTRSAAGMAERRGWIIRRGAGEEGFRRPGEGRL